MKIEHRGGLDSCSHGVGELFSWDDTKSCMLLRTLQLLQSVLRYVTPSDRISFVVVLFFYILLTNSPNDRVAEELRFHKSVIA